MANIPFLIGLLWGMHDVNKQIEKENNDLRNIDLDHLIGLTRETKRVQRAERYILDPNEKEDIINKLKDAHVDKEAIETIEWMMDELLMNRTAIMSIVNAFIKE